MKRLLLIGLLALSACRGKQGSTGPQGTPGLNGPKQIVINGTLDSDVFVVSDMRLTIGYNFDTFIGDGNGTEFQLPYSIPGLGENAYCFVNTTNGTVTIFNAKKAGMKNYTVFFDI